MNCPICNNKTVNFINNASLLKTTICYVCNSYFYSKNDIILEYSIRHTIGNQEFYMLKTNSNIVNISLILENNSLLPLLKIDESFPVQSSLSVLKQYTEKYQKLKAFS